MKRLLYIAHRVPYPPDKGERVRAFHEIRALAEHFRITLATLAHSEGDAEAASKLGQWCEKVLTGKAGGRLGLLRGGLSFAAGRSVTEGFFRSPDLAQAIAEEARREPFDLVIVYSSGTLPYVLSVPAKAHVMDLVDVDSAKWSAYANAAWWPKRWLYRREARGVAALERRAVECCDAVLLVSEAEKQALGITSPKVMAVGNGVDTEYFKPMDGPAGPPSLVFTGTMDYRPNIDGVCWFVREVLPQLKSRVPDLTFTIVGRDPAPEVLRLAGVPGITVTGTVRDVRPYLAVATVVVVPLRIARGIQNKILEAMAMGRAVVASPQAVEGLEVTVGADVLQADAPESWVRAVESLICDEPRRRIMEQAARTRVVADYTWPARMAPLVDLCEKMASIAATAQEPRAAQRPKTPFGGDSPREAGRQTNVMLPSRRLWWATAGYAALLSVVSLLPSGREAPLAWDAAITPEVQDVLHLPAYVLLVILLAAAIEASGTRMARSLAVAAAFSVLFGAAMEFGQSFVPGRTCSLKDGLVNAAGALLGVALAVVWRRVRRNRLAEQRNA